MSLQRYADYKDSGVIWLGEVPAHWHIAPIRHLTICLDSRRIPLNSEQRADRIGSIPYWGANCIMGYVDEALFDEELVLLGEDGAPFFDRTRPVAFFSIGPVWPNNHIHVLKPRESCQGKFLTYALNSTNYSEFIDGSTRDKLTQSEMNRIPIAVPSLKEQYLITAFLDRETAKIDALIAEQEKLIALLAEKRQATISHAVIKGLNPNAPMKDSGVAWLGEVPEHWAIYKGRQLGLLFGSGPVEEDDVQDDGVLPFIKVGSLSQDGFDIANWNWYVKDGVALKSKIYREFIVFPKRGAAIFLNKVNIVNCDAIIDPNLMGWKINEKFSNKYIAYLLKVRRLEELADVSTVPQINNKHIEPEKFPVPPVCEQCEIVAFIDAECSKIDQLREQAECASVLLKERRSALITAAVTGQIDVRNLTPEVPA